MPEFRTMITLVGQQKIAVAIAAQTPLTLTQMAVGDSNGVGYDPIEAQEELVNEKYREELDSVEVLTGGVIVCQMTIPITEGGWHIREAGVFDDEGDMIAVVRIADRYKPLPSSGQADDLTIMLKLDVGNVGAVTWAIDPQKKIHHGRLLRTFFQVVEAADVAAPPADPQPGATYVIPEGAAGAWAAFPHRLAQWTGLAWSIVEPHDGHIVRLGDSRRYLQRAAGGWQPWLFITDDMMLTIGAGGDFPDIVAASDWLSSRIIIDSAVVTLAFLAGDHVFNQDFIWDYSYGHAVRIVGQPLVGGDPVEANFAVTGYSSGQRAADNAANRAMLIAKYPSRIMLNGCTFRVFGTLGLLDDLLFLGDGSPVYGLDFSREHVVLGTLSVHGCGDDNIFQNIGAGIELTGTITSTGSGQDGFEFNGPVAPGRADAIATDNWLLAFGNNVGIDCRRNASVSASVIVARGNSGVGLNLTRSGALIGQATCSLNGSVGIAAESSTLRVTGTMVASSNGSDGVGAVRGTQIELFAGGTTNNNGRHGMRAFAGSVIASGGAVTANNNTQNGLRAEHSSSIYAPSPTTAGNGSAALSPVANTVGNNNSYISG